MSHFWLCLDALASQLSLEKKSVFELRESTVEIFIVCRPRMAIVPVINIIYRGSSTARREFSNIPMPNGSGHFSVENVWSLEFARSPSWLCKKGSMDS